MSLMGSLYIGTSGLQTSQNALNTTGHNLANLETTGYVRQQVYLSDKAYITIGASSVSSDQLGLGVTFSEVRQVRDYFLDQTYRTESGRASYYETMASVGMEVQVLFGELEGVAFQDTLQDLWSAVEALYNDPSNSVYQSAFVEEADLFLSRAKDVYNALNTYQNDLNSQVKSTVDQINTLGNTIKSLNDQIAKIEAGGVENANDLRDKRNLALDELSKLVEITYSEGSDGRITVSIEGTQFVTKDYVNEMGTKVIDNETGFVAPVWPGLNNQEVYDLSIPIKSSTNTDIGELKALLVARGDHRADYTDLSDADYYSETIQPSVIMNIQAEFDQLIHGIVTSINDVLCGGTGTVTAGEEPQELFVRKATGRYDETTGDYIAEDASDYDTLYTLGNLAINPDLLAEPTLLSFKLETGDVDYDKAKALKDAFDNTFSSLNPSLSKTYNFMEYYTEMVNQHGITTNIYSALADNLTEAAAETEVKRQAVIGVSSEEELSNMIMFQNAYNASSRYITTISDMLEHIINTLGA